MGTRSILFTCMGTRGDVQPFCALGQYLAARGWQVTMAAPAEFQEFVGNFKGLDFADIGRSIQVGGLFHVTWEGGQGPGAALHRVGVGQPWGEPRGRTWPPADLACPGPLAQKEVMETPVGQAMLTAGSLKIFKAARSFFNDGLFGSW